MQLRHKNSRPPLHALIASTAHTFTHERRTNRAATEKELNSTTAEHEKRTSNPARAHKHAREGRRRVARHCTRNAYEFACAMFRTQRCGLYDCDRSSSRSSLMPSPDTL